MTRVAILPISTIGGDIAYHAFAGGKLSQGKTAGEALDALTAQLPEDDMSTLVVVQNLRPDQFFTAQQQRRLGELMDLWRAARDTGGSLPAVEQTELDDLVEEEVRASGERTAALLREIGS